MMQEYPEGLFKGLAKGIELMRLPVVILFQLKTFQKIGVEITASESLITS